jgi:hypothetical protein
MFLLTGGFFFKEGLTGVKVYISTARAFGLLTTFSSVKDKGSAFSKSMLASKNLPKPITTPAEGQHWIRVLAAELALRLNDARHVSPNLWPKTLVLHAKKGAQLILRKDMPMC